MFTTLLAMRIRITFKSFGMYLPLLVLLVPAIWYSANTQFIFAEDLAYGTVAYGHTVIQALKGVLGIVFGVPSVVWRPLELLWKLLSWLTFGDRPSLHHLVSLSFILFTVVFAVRTIALFGTQNTRPFRLSIFVFLVVFLFFPNQPAARLTTTDPLFVLFLSAVIYYTGKAFVIYGGDLYGSKADYLKLLLAFLLLSWSRELSSAVMLVCLLFMALWNFSRRGILPLMPFIGILVFQIAKVYPLLIAGGYGTAPVTVDLIQSNLSWYGRSLILWETSRLFSIWFLLPIGVYLAGPLLHFCQALPRRVPRGTSLSGIQASLNRADKIFIFYAFISLTFIAAFAITLVLWAHVLRYFYQLVFLLALLMGLSFTGLASLSPVRRQIVQWLVVLGCSFFIVTNYYNWLHQFALQYDISAKDGGMLDTVAALAKEGAIVYVPGTGWQEGIARISRHPLEGPPDYQGKVRTLESANRNDPGAYYVTRDDWSLAGHVLYKSFASGEGSSGLLSGARSLSSVFQFGRPPFVWEDEGSKQYGAGGWYIYRNTVAISSLSVQTVLYTSAERFEIPGGEPYAQVNVPLPSTLTHKGIYRLTLEYQTKGGSVPYAIVLQASEIVLHQLLVPRAEVTAIECLFTPAFDAPVPILILRNWSKDGKFVVTKVTVGIVGP